MAVRLQDIVVEVWKAAEEHPDRVYNKGLSGGCEYAPDDINPDGCIIGAAARRAGLSLDKSYYGPVEVVLLSHLSDDERPEGLNAQDLEFLVATQQAQDEGWTWAEAVKIGNFASSARASIGKLEDIPENRWEIE